MPNLSKRLHGKKKTLTPDLKKALSNLPPPEKDKLLFRLLLSNPSLVEQLRFQLLETGNTKELRRDEIRETIETSIDKYQSYYYSPGYLLMLLRDLSGEINRHVKTTKDKYGEVELNFLMLNKSLSLFGAEVAKTTPQRSRTFNNYIIKRAVKLMNLLGKMHEDLVLDFQPAMKELAGHIRKNANLMSVAEVEGLKIGVMEEGFLMD